MGPDVGQHPLKKNGAEQKPGAGGVDVGGEVGEHVVHELRGLAVPQLRELQQQLGLLIVGLRLNFEEMRAKVVVQGL